MKYAKPYGPYGLQIFPKRFNMSDRALGAWAAAKLTVLSVGMTHTP
ncbi:hypothetical protein [Caballeronia sp.]